MNKFLSLCCLLLLLTDTAVGASLQTAANTNTKPNIILILLDDLGWRDTGFMGNTFIETPALDKLAREGLVLTNAYSNAPNCAPSRAAIVSGQYAPRTDVYTMIKGDMGDERLRRVLTPANKMYLEPATITLAEMLRSAGYRTAHIGKWNLGSGDVRGPTGQGFDVNIAGERNGYAHNGYFAPYDLPGLENAPAGEYLTDRLTQESIKFIKQDNATKPFFIYLSHFAPHFPFQAPDTLIKKYRAKQPSAKTSAQPHDETYAAMVDSVDQGVGEIISALKDQHMDNNTLIIFTSDNGGYESFSYMNPLRGQKSLLYEGGIRVPLLLWWPGHIAPGISDTPAMGIDIFPTLMKAAGITAINQVIDGVDLSPLFTQTPKKLQRDALFWYFPAYVLGSYHAAADSVFQQRPAAVIRKGEWKLIQYLDSSRVEMYDLKNDPAEENNLADQKPDKQDELARDLQTWLTDMKLETSLPANPNYDARYEQQYRNSWWRKLRQKMGWAFPENDLQ